MRASWWHWADGLSDGGVEAAACRATLWHLVEVLPGMAMIGGDWPGGDWVPLADHLRPHFAAECCGGMRHPAS